MHDAAPEPADLFVHGGTLLTPDGPQRGDLLIRGGAIAAIGPQLTAPVSSPQLDAHGKLVFPGLIDPQVHFREPGWTHKEDLASGSLAAVAGGVTCFMEMPNTVPTTTDPAALEDKLRRAQGRSWADHAFFLGATKDNADQLGEWEQLPGCAGIKVFMGSSTGSLLVPDDATLERVLRSGSRRVAVHSEHEPRLRERYAALDESAVVREHHNVRDVACAVMATERLLKLAEKTGRKIHLLHVSTAEEVAMLRERDLGDLVTAEVTPNHLFLSAPECYERWGSLAQMNPPVRDLEHQEALRAGLRDGVLTCIGSDHAPHTLAEKARPYPQSPSGIPGVQTILPLLLTAVENGWLSLADVVRVTASGPAQAYGIAGKGALEVGYDGDVCLVDPRERGPLPLEWLRSRAGFSPYVGMRLSGWPVATVLRGRLVYAKHATAGVPQGAPLRFEAP
ncbi:MAG: dihydroorotase [Planctomycetota bacterium]